MCIRDRSNSFHLAIPAGDLKKAEAFYTDILGCKTGNREDGKWVDIDFWGNELTLHKTDMKLPSERHDVDMGTVPVPHFGVHLDPQVFEKIKSNTLLIWGEEDTISPVDMGAWYNSHIPNSKFIRLPEVGHNPHFESPDVCQDEITSWLENHLMNQRGTNNP